MHPLSIEQALLLSFQWHTTVRKEVSLYPLRKMQRLVLILSPADDNEVIFGASWPKHIQFVMNQDQIVITIYICCNIN